MSLQQHCLHSFKGLFIKVEQLCKPSEMFQNLEFVFLSSSDRSLLKILLCGVYLVLNSPRKESIIILIFRTYLMFILKLILQVALHDTMPKKVCALCTKDLKTCGKIVERFKQADEYLQDIAQSPMFLENDTWVGSCSSSSSTN